MDVGSRSTRQRTAENGAVLLCTSETHQILYFAMNSAGSDFSRKFTFHCDITIKYSSPHFKFIPNALFHHFFYAYNYKYILSIFYTMLEQACIEVFVYVHCFFHRGSQAVYEVLRAVQTLCWEYCTHI